MRKDVVYAFTNHIICTNSLKEDGLDQHSLAILLSAAKRLENLLHLLSQGGSINDLFCLCRYVIGLNNNHDSY
jgi:hypothetical protein